MSLTPHALCSIAVTEFLSLDPVSLVLARVDPNTILSVTSQTSLQSQRSRTVIGVE